MSFFSPNEFLFPHAKTEVGERLFLPIPVNASGQRSNPRLANRTMVHGSYPIDLSVTFLWELQLHFFFIDERPCRIVRWGWEPFSPLLSRGFRRPWQGRGRVCSFSSRARYDRCFRLVPGFCQFPDTRNGLHSPSLYDDPTTTVVLARPAGLFKRLLSSRHGSSLDTTLLTPLVVNCLPFKTTAPLSRRQRQLSSPDLIVSGINLINLISLAVDDSGEYSISPARDGRALRLPPQGKA